MTKEVVHEALRLLNKRDMLQKQRRAELWREIAIGLEDLDNGRGIRQDKESTKAVFEEIKREGRKAL